MKVKSYIIFGLFIILSSVLVSAGSFIIKNSVNNGDAVIRLDHGDVILKDGELTSYGNSKIEVIPSTPFTSIIQADTIPAKAGFIRGEDCGYFEEQGVSHTGDYSCENGDIIISDEFVVKLG